MESQHDPRWDDLFKKTGFLPYNLGSIVETIAKSKAEEAKECQEAYDIYCGHIAAPNINQYLRLDEAYKEVFGIGWPGLLEHTRIDLIKGGSKERAEQLGMWHYFMTNTWAPV